MNMIEKILAKASGMPEVRPGDVVIADVDAVVMHDFSCYLVQKVFEEEVPERKIAHPDRVVVGFEHYFSPASEQAATILDVNRRFCRKYGIKNLFDGGEGMCHYLMVEKGFVKPGAVIVGSDSHTTCYGTFGAFATGVGNNSIAAMVLPHGKVWLRVPPTIKIELRGSLPEGTSSRDVMQYVLGALGDDVAIYRAIEWDGELIYHLDVEQRFIFPLMSVEMGAKCGYIVPDDRTVAYIQQYTKDTFEVFTNDPDVKYEKVFTFDVSHLEPQVTCPPSVSNVKPVREVLGTPIQQAAIGSCTNGRLEDLRVAANILRGRRVAPGVRLLVIPGTRKIYEQAQAEGILSTLFEAGANIFPPSCGPCQTVNMGALAAGEAMISTQPRNFPGRTGSVKAMTYLASPATVAASAITGRISDPRDFMN